MQKLRIITIALSFLFIPAFMAGVASVWASENVKGSAL